MKENHITMNEVAKNTNISSRRLRYFLSFITDITINELKMIKEYLVDLGVINEAYDYCDLLDLVDDE